MALPTSGTLLIPIREGSGGDRDLVINWDLATPVFHERDEILTQDDASSFPVPSTATLAIVIPPLTNTQQIRLDSGLGKKLGKTTPFVIPIDGDSAITLHLAAGTNQTIHVICV